MIDRRTLLATLATLALPRAAGAETYPSRLIKMIVPFAPGGPADTMARLAVQILSTGVGQNVIIDNRPGAGGSITAKAAANAEPDGYTLMFGNTATFAVAPRSMPTSVTIRSSSSRRSRCSRPAPIFW
jgi:tripartite-type tricarboxylate transporter receptor subunit TctC